MGSITLEGVRKLFGDLAVIPDIDLDIADGEFVVFVGPSGCGKSTLLRLIAGLEDVTSGHIRIDGADVTKLPPAKRGLAMVFQSYALYPSMTVRQNITFGMECRRVPRREQGEALERVARLLQIENLLDRRPSQLSGGQRQRVAMGRALVRDPLLFLFDEPLSNLDAKLRVEMRMEIKELHQRIHSTIVYVTHDQVEAMTMASRIAVMHLGEVQQFADPDTIYNRPANLFVAGFMGSPPMNTVRARIVADGNVPSALIGDGRPDQIRLPLPTNTNIVLRDREVVLGIRPEAICEEYRRFGDDPRLSIQVDAPVEMTEPMGAETVVVLRLGGEKVLGRIAPDIHLVPGTTGRFSLDTRKLCLFDPATERLIA